jgi:hypothetical protein
MKRTRLSTIPPLHSTTHSLPHRIPTPIMVHRRIRIAKARREYIQAHASGWHILSFSYYYFGVERVVSVIIVCWNERGVE